MAWPRSNKPVVFLPIPERKFFVQHAQIVERMCSDWWTGLRYRVACTVQGISVSRRSSRGYFWDDLKGKGHLGKYWGPTPRDQASSAIHSQAAPVWCWHYRWTSQKARLSIPAWSKLSLSSQIGRSTWSSPIRLWTLLSENDPKGYRCLHQNGYRRSEACAWNRERRLQQQAGASKAGMRLWYLAKTRPLANIRKVSRYLQVCSSVSALFHVFGGENYR